MDKINHIFISAVSTTGGIDESESEETDTGRTTSYEKRIVGKMNEANNPDKRNIRLNRKDVQERRKIL